MQDTTKTALAVDTRTAAKLLGVSKSHLEKMRTEAPDSSPPFFNVGRCIRYPVSGLHKWMGIGIANGDV